MSYLQCCKENTGENCWWRPTDSWTATEAGPTVQTVSEKNFCASKLLCAHRVCQMFQAVSVSLGKCQKTIHVSAEDHKTRQDLWKIKLAFLDFEIIFNIIEMRLVCFLKVFRHSLLIIFYFFIFREQSSGIPCSWGFWSSRWLKRDGPLKRKKTVFEAFFPSLLLFLWILERFILFLGNRKWEMKEVRNKVIFHPSIIIFIIGNYNFFVHFWLRKCLEKWMIEALDIGVSGMNSLTCNVIVLKWIYKESWANIYHSTFDWCRFNSKQSQK